MRSTDRARELRKALVARYGGKCDSCPSRSRLEFAHLRPTGLSGRGRGRWERLLDIRRHPDAYALKCKKCHWLFDLEREQRERLAERKRIAEAEAEA